MPAPPPHDVLILGGGLAGLAAAVGLAEHGVSATILESRPRLGGRASSFQDTATGQWIDNCQHVTMGCCTNFRAFCETTGIAAGFRRERVLYFLDPNGRVNRFAASPLPAPFHLAGTFARLSYLTLSDKLALGRGLKALAHPATQSATGSFADWLAGQRQPPRVIERFWHVVLVSALSETLDRIAVPAARKVFVDGFLAHRQAWEVDIPRVPLEVLYGTTLTQWLTEHGVTLRLLQGAERVTVGPEEVTSIRLRDGEVATANDYILAVPHHRLSGLLAPAALAADPRLSLPDQLETAPIASWHLWFDRPITPLPHAVFVEGLVQWLFHRTALADQPPSAGEPYYYQVVISASRELLAQPTEVTQQRILDELSRAFPETRAATLLRARQVIEHRAVFSPTPGSEALRPPQQTVFPNLQLAGDYTQTGWPATMEGAVRSGFLAAENILRRRGVAARLVRPDLPLARASRWLFGL
jgi:squalene-associated FAD-dependent desaturase